MKLVITLVELLRQLMERQALHRVDEGDLQEEQEERIGATGPEPRPRSAGHAPRPAVRAGPQRSPAPRLRSRLNARALRVRTRAHAGRPRNPALTLT
ncbi:gas vesicle protein K [Streptomyces lunaelactis]|uniref:gas vesicle protein K n=1 Tax=Streptomyces lunaelactis TaxID=1535768 RepID=UPI0035A034DE